MALRGYPGAHAVALRAAVVIFHLQSKHLSLPTSRDDQQPSV